MRGCRLIRSCPFKNSFTFPAFLAFPAPPRTCKKCSRQTIGTYCKNEKVIRDANFAATRPKSLSTSNQCNHRSRCKLPPTPRAAFFAQKMEAWKFWPVSEHQSRIDTESHGSSIKWRYIVYNKKYHSANMFARYSCAFIHLAPHFQYFFTTKPRISLFSPFSGPSGRWGQRIWGCFGAFSQTAKIHISKTYTEKEYIQVKKMFCKYGNFGIPSVTHCKFHELKTFSCVLSLRASNRICPTDYGRNK